MAPLKVRFDNESGHLLPAHVSPLHFVVGPRRNGFLKGVPEAIYEANRQWDSLYVKRRSRKRYREPFIRYLFGNDMAFHPKWTKPERVMLPPDHKYGDPYLLEKYILTAPIEFRVGGNVLNEDWWEPMEQFESVYRARRPRKLFAFKPVALALRRIGYDLAET